MLPGVGFREEGRERHCHDVTLELRDSGGQIYRRKQTGGVSTKETTFDREALLPRTAAERYRRAYALGWHNDMAVLVRTLCPSRVCLLAEL